jgi:hypothetical protein
MGEDCILLHVKMRSRSGSSYRERSQMRELKRLSLGAICRELRSNGLRTQLKSSAKIQGPWVRPARLSSSWKKAYLSSSWLGPEMLEIQTLVALDWDSN